MPCRFSQIPAVGKHFMEELGGFDLIVVFRRDHAHGRFEDFPHPVCCHDLQRLILPPCGCAVRIQIVEQAAGLVLLHVQPGKAQQLARCVPCVHDLRPYMDMRPVFIRIDSKLIDVKAKLIKLIDTLFDFPHLVRRKCICPCQCFPQ